MHALNAMCHFPGMRWMLRLVALCLCAVSIPALAAPDLEIMSLAITPNRGTPGTSVTVNVSIRNIGDREAAPSTAYIRLGSSGTEDSESDLRLGEIEVPLLAPGATYPTTKDVQIHPDTNAGTRHLWLILDATSSAGQSNRNNDKASRPFSVVVSELVIESMTIKPASGLPGTNSTLQLKIRNRGTDSRPSRTFIRLAPSGTRLTSADPLLLEFEVPAIRAGDLFETGKTIRIPENTSAGRKYVWVILDVTDTAGQGLANEANDRANVPFHVVTVLSDIAIETLSVTPSVGLAGTDIKVSYSIRNHGEGPALPSRSFIRLGESSLMPQTGDPLLSQFDLPGIAAGATHEGAQTVRIPPNIEPGTKYVWLLLDVTDTAGQDAANYVNDRRATPFAVNGGLVDLVIQALTVKPASGLPGTTSTLTLTVKNEGAVPAAPSVAIVQLATTAATVTEADPVTVATVNVPAIGAGSVHTEQVLIAIPPGTPVGRHHVRVTLDTGRSAGQGELNEGNDRGSTPFDVVTVFSSLVIEQLRVDPPAGLPGSRRTVSYTIRNDGPGVALASRAVLRINASPGAVLDEDPLLAQLEIAELPVGQRHEGSPEVTIPPNTTAGTKYVWLSLDVTESAGQGGVNELDDQDKMPFEVTGEHSDLVTGTLKVKPASGPPQTRSTLTLTIRNDGSVAAPPSTAEIRLTSSATSVTDADRLLRTFDVPEIARGGTLKDHKVTIDIPPDATVGRKYVWVRLDRPRTANQGPENTANDESSTPFDVVTQLSDIVAETIRVTPTSVPPGSYATVSFTVRNKGVGPALPSFAFLRIAETSARPQVGDPLLAELQIPAIPAGTTHSVTQIVKIPPVTLAGTRYMWVLLDVTDTAGQGDQNDDDDWIGTPFQVGTSPDQADLAALDMTVSPAKAVAGMAVTVAFSIVNDGKAEAPASTALLQLSRSPSGPTANDMHFLKTIPIPPLRAQERVQIHSVTITVPLVSSGLYYVWLTADATGIVAQADTRNDRTSALLEVEELAQPAIFTVLPDPVIVSPAAQRLTIQGVAFDPGSRVILRDGTLGTQEILTRESYSRTELVASGTIADASHVYTLQVSSNATGGKTGEYRVRAANPPSCTAVCSISAPPSVALGIVASFSAAVTSTTCSGEMRFDWTFGDQSAPATGSNVTHRFTQPGLCAQPGRCTWTVDASVNGKLAYRQRGDIIVGDSLKADFTWEPVSPIAGTAVQFIDRSTGSPAAWTWHFDDVESGGQNPVHVFTSEGPHPVRLVVQRPGQAASSVQMTITVLSSGNAPVPAFRFDPAQPDAGQTVTFSSESLGAELSYEWDFNGDAVTDATSATATHAFPSAGNHQVRLTVRNSYGSESTRRTLTVRDAGTKPVITSAAWIRGNVFLDVAGSVTPAVLRVNVDWKGLPGQVSFAVAGGTPVPGVANGSAYELALGRDMLRAADSTQVTIVATNSSGVSSEPRAETVYLYALPRGFAQIQARQSSAVREIASSSDVKYHFEFDYPDPRWDDTSRLVPQWVPWFGEARFGIDQTAIAFTGEAAPMRGDGNLVTAGEAAYHVAGQRVSVRLRGSGRLDLAPPRGLVLTQASVTTDVRGKVSQEEGLLTAVPALQALQTAPVIGKLLEEMESFKVPIEIAPRMEGALTLAQDGEGDLVWNPGIVKFTLRLDGAAQTRRGPMTLKVRAAGNGEGRLAAPPLRSTEAALLFRVGYKAEFDGLFEVDSDGITNFVCRSDAISGGAFDCGTTNEARSVRSESAAKTVGLVAIDHRYERFGAASAITNVPVPRTGSSRIPVSSVSTAVVTNVFPAASPVVLDLGDGSRLLLWEDQRADLPNPQSTDIAWSIDEGAGWSSPQLVAQDRLAEFSPRAAIDAHGNVVVAWLRIRAAYDGTVRDADELAQFYKRLDVVSATFDPATRIWSETKSVTEDEVADLDLQMSDGGDGRIMLSWLSNAQGELVSTPTARSEVKAAFWNGSGWTQPRAVVSNVIGVSEHAAALGASTATIAFADRPSALESRIQTHVWNGSRWSAGPALGDGTQPNLSPTVAYDGSQRAHVVWIGGDALMHAVIPEPGGGEPGANVVRPDSAIFGLLDSRLFPIGRQLILVWRRTSREGAASIYATLLDPNSGKGSADRLLDETAGVASEISGFTAGDEIQLAYLSTALGPTTETVTRTVDGRDVDIPDVPIDAATDIRVLRHSLIHDLAVENGDVTIDVPTPIEGQAVTATVVVHNGGDFSTGAFKVRLFEGTSDERGPQVGEAEVSAPFLAGDSRELAFKFPFPASGRIVAVVDAEKVIRDDFDDNNIAAFDASNRPPVALLTASITSGKSPLTVSFDASGSIDSDGGSLTYLWSFGDGTEAGKDQQATHTFTRPGRYLVTAIATDSKGAQSIATVEINVQGKRRAARR